MGLDIVDLVVKIEKRFDIDIQNSDAEAMATVGAIHTTVARYLQQKGDEQYTPQQLQTIISEMIADHAGLSLGEITPEKSLTNDLGLD